MKVPLGQGAMHGLAAPSAFGGSKSRGLPVWQGRVLHRWLRGIRTATVAVSLHQASHSLPPSPPHSIPAPCQPFSHNRHQCHVVLGSTCKLHGPRRSFTTVGSLGPMAMVRDAPCLGQGRTPA